MIWAASRFAGSPAPEKIGSFWPRTSVFRPSIAETPVWTKSAGLSRAYGLIGIPLMSGRSSGTMGGPLVPGPSQAVEDPPEHLERDIEPRRLAREADRGYRGRRSRFVPSKTWTTATSREMSSTCPVRVSPSGRTIAATSPYEMRRGRSTKISGPET